MATDRLVVNVFNVDAALNVARGEASSPRNGLDVELLVTPNSTDQMRGLGKGAWHIVSTAFDNVLGWSGREGAEICRHCSGIPGNYIASLREARDQELERIFAARSLPWMLWTRPTRWSCGESSWRTAWISIGVIMNSYRWDNGSPFGVYDPWRDVCRCS